MKFLIIAFWFALCGTAGANAEPLSNSFVPRGYPDFANFLIRAELMLEAETWLSSSPYRVRIWRVRDEFPLECDGKPETCPKWTLIVAIRASDDYAQTSVFELPKAYGWELISRSDQDRSANEISVLLKRKDISKDLEQQWFVETQVEIRFNESFLTIIDANM